MNQSILLNDGNRIPPIGLGVFNMAAGETTQCVGSAIDAGYQAVDTAAMYGNEAEVGQAVRASGRPIFVTTKIWHSAHGFDAALAAFDQSYDRLGLDVVDLCLIHWPAPGRGLYVETWKALVRLRDEGRVRSIGVSNFTIEQIDSIVGATGIVPAVNQIELHPRFQQSDLRAFHRARNIATISWSPLGRGQELANPTIVALAGKHRRTPAQIVLRWHVEHGLIPIPKSVDPKRQAENIAIFDFALDAEDRAAMESLNDPRGRFGPDPMTFGN